jgi:tetratricopeptide (TPR) repeat protein
MALASCSENISNKADNLFAQKQYEEAVEEYNKVLKNNPKYFKGLYNRGTCL